jgi:hypothetical protein
VSDEASSAVAGMCGHPGMLVKGHRRGHVIDEQGQPAASDDKRRSR